MQPQIKPFQDLVKEISAVFGATVGITDISQTVIACSDTTRVGTVNLAAQIGDNTDTFTRDGYTFKAFGDKERPEYTVFIEGTDGLTEKYASMLSVALTSVKTYFDEKYNRTNFIKNVILENIMPGDLAVKARELRFSLDSARVVLLIRILDSNEFSAFDVIQNLFPDKNKDFVFNHDDTDIVLVKEIKDGIDEKDLNKLARSIVDTLGSEFYTNVNIGIGSSVMGIKDLAISFKEAQTALEVGKVFDVEKVIINYSNLGIARLIYHLPVSLCEVFMSEVFKRGGVESLDHETLFTIQKFFENNLNVSETSRKLFVHRNTLVYRLEKIKKLTGLDLREFDHAIIFKIALMVKRFLSEKPTKY